METFVLHFNPPINTESYLQYIYGVLDRVYPNITWRDGQELSDFDPFGWVNDIDYIVVHHGAHISWGQIGDYNDEEDKIVDGQEWIQAHNVNYDETNNLFNSLDS